MANNMTKPPVPLQLIFQLREITAGRTPCISRLI